MWSTNQTDQIPLASVTMRQHCPERHSAFPSSSHSAESNVKDANCCSVIGRDAHLTSMCSTARSGLAEQLQSNCKKVAGGLSHERKFIRDWGEIW